MLEGPNRRGDVRRPVCRHVVLDSVNGTSCCRTCGQVLLTADLIARSQTELLDWQRRRLLAQDPN
jgi:hypothetical protein